MKIEIYELKSDQNGIEICFISCNVLSTSIVKIRPKWD